MGKKMKLPFLPKNKDVKSSWPWPSCNQPRTLSFRNNNDIFKTINSAYLDATLDSSETHDQAFFTNSSSDSTSLSTASEDDPIETVIRGLHSERLFYEPEETSSILESKASIAGLPFKESVLLSMESKDPSVDFRKSMEEMVEAHGLKDWEDFEQLLSWYLRVNGKSNHGYIVVAFVDLLTGLAISSRPCSCSCPPDCSDDHSSSSPLSFYTSSSASSSSSTPCLSCLETEEEPGTPSSSSTMLLVKKVDTGFMNDEATSSSSTSTSNV